MPTGTTSVRASLSLREIVLGIIALKPEYTSSSEFKEEELEQSLRKACANYPQLTGLLQARSDGGQETTNHFSTIMGFGLMGNIVRYTDDVTKITMPRDSQLYLKNAIRRRYGREAFDQLRTIAEKIWKS